MVRSREEAACWLIPSSVAAAPRLLVRAMPTSSSSERSSGT